MPLNRLLVPTLSSVVAHVILLMALLICMSSDNTGKPNNRLTVSIAIKPQQNVHTHPVNKNQETVESVERQPEPEHKDPPILFDDPRLLVQETYRQRDQNASKNQTNPDTMLVDGEMTRVIERQAERKKVERKGYVSSRASLAESVEGWGQEESTMQGAEKGDALKGAQAIDSQGEDKTGIESNIASRDALNNIEWASRPGNASLMTDVQLSTNYVEDPLSEKHSREIKLVNGYLKAIGDLVIPLFRRPETDGHYRGRLVFEIKKNGTLGNVSVIIPSGSQAYDNAALSAVRAVSRFPVVANEILRERYFRRIAFIYGSGGIEYELMPFERE